MTSQPISWWSQLRLLLDAERRRSVGRKRKAFEKRKKGLKLVGFGWGVLLGGLIQACLAGVFLWLAHVAVVVSIERNGPMVVSDQTWELMHQLWPEGRAGAESTSGASSGDARDEAMSIRFQHEAGDRHFDRGGSSEQWHRLLMKRFHRRGAAGFVPEASVGRAQAHQQMTYEVLALALIIWWLALVFQGESGTLDTLRRRHPMWEWYLALPMSQTAVFVGEALAPAIANIYLLTSPVALAVIVGWLHHSVLLGLSMLIVAVPLLLAATLWAKALEVLVMLRSPVRSRGGWFAVFAAFGTLMMLGPMVTIQLRSLAFDAMDQLLPWLHVLPSARWLLDITDPLSWLRALGTSLAIGIVAGVPAIVLMRMATKRGLESGFGTQEKVVETGAFEQRPGRWLRLLDDPLVRKERLWFKRDRGALVQLILLPMILLGSQLANFHNMLSLMDMTWNKVAGVIVLVATMLLATATPRALLSEGPGLMLTMSWPRSLEDTLRVKVRVLFALVTAMLLLGMGVTIWIFPADVLPILGVTCVWFVSGLCVAEKAITNLRAPDSSGQIEPLQRGQFKPASFGNTTLAVAIITAQWQLAFIALVMNWVFAAALWQGFRIRLAYLFDPECAPALRPPSVLTSVIAVVGYIELGALLTVPLSLWFGKDAAAFAMTIGYAMAAIVVGSIVVNWNSNRSFGVVDTLTLDKPARLLPPAGLLSAVVAGAALAVVAFGYQHLLMVLPIPALHDLLVRQAQLLVAHPDLRTAYAIAAVAVAPWIEEYLFRGLLFRSMLPQWGLQRAAAASAAFFAVLHPMTAWPLVFVLGYGNALLFARTRSLVPSMLLHACYNAALLYLTFG